MQQQEVIIERDIDQDRFCTYEQYTQFISALTPLSKNQMFFITLGVTGWRPCEAVLFRIQDIDREKRRLRYTIAKPKHFYKGEYLVKLHKVKWRAAPEWYFSLLDSYIAKNFMTMVDGYIFPSRDNSHGKHMTVEGFQVEFSRIKEQLYAANPVKWSWLKEHYQVIRYPNGREQKYYRFSLYSFRKMHCTYFARMLEDKGIGDVVIHTAKHMGHNKVDTTMKYLRSLIDEDKMAEGIKKAVDYSLEFAAGLPKPDKCQRRLAEY